MELASGNRQVVPPREAEAGGTGRPASVLQSEQGGDQIALYLVRAGVDATTDRVAQLALQTGLRHVAVRRVDLDRVLARLHPRFADEELDERCFHDAALSSIAEPGRLIQQGDLPVREAMVRLLGHLVPTARFERLYRTAAAINEEAYDVIDHAKRSGSPFFLLVNYMDAHAPYLPPPEFARLFEAKDPGFSKWSMDFDLDGHRVRMDDPAMRQHLVSQYDAAIAYIDSELGKLIDHLRQADLFADSLLIITSDHGESFGEHGYWWHNGVSTYEELLHVPLIVKYPGSANVGSVDTRVSLADLGPTILAVVGEGALPDAPGQVLRESALDATRDILAESFSPEGVVRALLVGPKKLIRPTSKKPEFYDLSEDPAETRNSYLASPAVADLEGRLESWISRVPEREDASIDEAARRQKALDGLRRLGYVR